MQLGAFPAGHQAEVSPPWRGGACVIPLTRGPQGTRIQRDGDGGARGCGTGWGRPLRGDGVLAWGDGKVLATAAATAAQQGDGAQHRRAAPTVVTTRGPMLRVFYLDSQIQGEGRQLTYDLVHD